MSNVFMGNIMTCTNAIHTAGLRNSGRDYVEILCRLVQEDLHILKKYYFVIVSLTIKVLTFIPFKRKTHF